jgi:hypothetical protein
MNSPKYKRVLAPIIVVVSVIVLVYLLVFGRALRQSENHLGIVFAIPKVILSTEAARVDDITYLAKDGPSFIGTIERQGFTFDEQMGSAYIFKKDGARYISTSRMYSSFFMVFTRPALQVTDFEECAQAGYPVGESYPRQCWSPSGGHFVETVPQGSHFQASTSEIISELKAIEIIKNQFPELKGYPSDMLPPQSIKTEKTDDGWYLAFIQEGSARANYRSP